LSFDRLKLYLNLDRPLTESELEHARSLVRRRASREPVAYILGRREFLSRTFEVGPGVLIPRPETELLVEQAETELKRRFSSVDSDYRILEFGIGSGCVAISLCLSLLQAKVVATEISPAASKIAAGNAERHGVSNRIDIRLQPDFHGIDGRFHAIVSNPPYVDPAAKETLEPDVALFEPPEALFAENNGLRWYQFLIDNAPQLLEPGGFLLLETGVGQHEPIAQFAADHGMTVEKIVKDYAGIQRIMRLGLALV
jgi:release factor glutamine methyltransferase